MQVVLDKNLNLKMFVLGKNISYRNLNSLEEFETIMNEFASQIVCVGGPPFEKYKSAESKQAYKDTANEFWRHIECCLILNKTKKIICNSCSKLDYILRTQQWRIKQNINHKKHILL